ncbi:MAG: MFS transporter, partial [Halobacteriota archaeon]
ALTIYVAVGIVVSPIIGKLGDMYGKKKFWVIGTGIFAISVALTGLAWSLPSFIIFRAFSGFGLATFPLSYGLIRDEFPANRVAPSLGVLTAALGAGAASGVLMAGVLTQAFGWRWNFFIVARIVLIIALFGAYKLVESPVWAPGRLDLGGATALSTLFCPPSWRGRSGDMEVDLGIHPWFAHTLAYVRAALRRYRASRGGPNASPQSIPKQQRFLHPYDGNSSRDFYVHDDCSSTLLV